MRYLIAGLALAVVLCAGHTLAAEGETVVVVERIQDIQLTADQETKIEEIRKECGPEVQKAAKNLMSLRKEEVEKVREVLTADQKTKLKELKEERKERRHRCMAHRFAHLKDLDLTGAEMTKIEEIRKEFRPKIAKALAGLKDTLTPEQRKTREEALKAGKKHREVIAALKLSDDQKTKVVAVCKEVGALVREETEKIRDVLTETQKEKLQEYKGERRERVRDRIAHRIANLKDLDLSDDQKAKISKIRLEYRPKIQEAGNKLRALVREEAHKIIGVLKG
jgi:Spy/CpxP family protein refolding chaperone